MLYFPTSDREDLGKDDSTFYIQDLVGLQVATVAGQHVGRVVEVCDGTGSHDCLRVLREPEVRRDDGRYVHTLSNTPTAHGLVLYQTPSRCPFADGGRGRGVHHAGALCAGDRPGGGR